jgi:basic membrane protein A
MSKKLYIFLALLLVASMVLAGCKPAAEEPAAEEPAAEEVVAEEPAAEEPAAEEAAVKVCQVTDAGGIDDKSFNATAWVGVQNAIENLGVEGKYLESQQQTDYEKNINAFLEEDCDLIVTVGFLLGDATAAAAEANPDQKFAIIDVDYLAFDNLLDLAYNTDEAAFLAGYLAAGMTKTGKVGTFGGIQFPSVSIFMDGFSMGVAHYNEVHATEVEVLGWDTASQTGLFVGNFESADDGRNMAITLMDEGADIIMPVAGPVGLGTAAAVQEAGDAWIIGVDSDWFASAPEYADVTLTSVLKKMDQSVYDTISYVVDGTFAGGVYYGTLENGGVGIAPFHNAEEAVPAELVAELEALQAAIIAGEIVTYPAEAPYAGAR